MTISDCKRKIYSDDKLKHLILLEKQKKPTKNRIEIRNFTIQNAGINSQAVFK